MVARSETTPVRVPERSPRLARDDRPLCRDAGDPPHGSEQALPGRPCGRPRLARHPDGRVLLDARAERLRQDHDPPDDRRVRAPHGRPDRAARTRRHDGPSGQAAGQHGLPELRPVPPPRRRRKHRLRAPAEERRQGPDQAPGLRGPGPGPSRRLRQAKAEPALGRPAAAGRACPGPREPAGRPPPRRAARSPRPEAPQGAPDRAEAGPVGGGDHVRLRHPRPGGGAHDERPDRRHARRKGRAAGHPRGALRAPADAVRRRLHRDLEPDGRDRRSGRRGNGRWSA